MNSLYIDGTLYAMKVARTVWSGGKDGDNFKILPITIVYGIALTAMSFFTDPTISTLTSGKPSQNFDAKGLSFPRRIGVRFASQYLEKNKYVGLQSVWESYSDSSFVNKLDDKLFGHTQTIDREGWARYFFEGKYDNIKNYIKLKIINPKTNLLVRCFYFEVELTYKTDLSGRKYIKDPVLGTKIIKDGVMRELKFSKKKDKYVYKDTLVKRKYRDLMDLEKPEELIDIPAFSQKSVKYTERPKAVFFITPPHLMSYAKLILILIKQMVDVNFESSYLTKENQKPLYKTRYMLDEVGNLQSEGQGIPALQTMLSIGLGQDQQFTLILQTLQQLRDVYGESVDKIIQGNVDNIVFLKSTDDSMIDTLVKMSGTTHEVRKDSKSISEDLHKIGNKNDGRVTYNLTNKERPVIEFNDFMFIKPRSSIVIKSGVPPLWNKDETTYPMSYRLLKDTLKIPGKEFSLQTIPTNSSAKDFDVRKNQPNFFNMLKQRIAQAKMSDVVKQSYMDAYDLTEADLLQKDQNVVADDIMHAINSSMFDIYPSAESVPKIDTMGEEELNSQFDEYGDLIDNSVDNVEVQEAKAQADLIQNENKTHRYAEGHIGRDSLVSVSGQVNRSLDSVLAKAYSQSIQYFKNDNNYRVSPTNELSSSTGVLYVKSSTGTNSDDVDIMANAESDDNSRVYSEEPITKENFYEVTDSFIKNLASCDSWKDIAKGRFDIAVSKEFQKSKM